MRVINGFDAQSETRVYDASRPGTKAPFHEDLRATSGWRRFAVEFGATAENLAQIPPVMQTLGYDSELCSVAQFEDALIAAMDAGRMTRKPAVPVAPVDKNGRKLSAAQIQWGDFSRWSETASISDRKERQRVDPAYRAYVEQQWKLRLNENPVGGDMREFNPHLKPQAPPTKAALSNKAAIEFAQMYNRMTADQVRAARSKAINPLTFQSFIDQTEECIRMRLL